jgi:type I restriction enzyme R subunit
LREWRLPLGEQFKLIATATNHLVAEDEPCQRFMLNEKKLSSLPPIVKNHAAV